MAVVAVPFILYLVRFCSSKSCKKSTGTMGTDPLPVPQQQRSRGSDSDQVGPSQQAGSDCCLELVGGRTRCRRSFIISRTMMTSLYSYSYLIYTYNSTLISRGIELQSARHSIFYHSLQGIAGITSEPRRPCSLASSGGGSIHSSSLEGRGSSTHAPNQEPTRSARSSTDCGGACRGAMSARSPDEPNPIGCWSAVTLVLLLAGGFWAVSIRIDPRDHVNTHRSLIPTKHELPSSRHSCPPLLIKGDRQRFCRRPGATRTAAAALMSLPSLPSTPHICSRRPATGPLETL